MMRPDGGAPSYPVDPEEYLLVEAHQQVRDAGYNLGAEFDGMFQIPNGVLLTSEWASRKGIDLVSEEYRKKTTVVPGQNEQISYHITNGDVTCVTYGPGSRSWALARHIRGQNLDTYELLVVNGMQKEDIGAQTEYLTARYLVHSEPDFLSAMTIGQVLELVAGSADGPETVELLERGSLWEWDARKSVDDPAAQERVQRGLRHSHLAIGLLDELAQPAPRRSLRDGWLRWAIAAGDELGAIGISV